MANKIKCRHCGRYYTKWGIKNHERSCVTRPSQNELLSRHAAGESWQSMADLEGVSECTIRQWAGVYGLSGERAELGGFPVMSGQGGCDSCQARAACCEVYSRLNVVLCMHDIDDEIEDADNQGIDIRPVIDKIANLPRIARVDVRAIMDNFERGIE